MSAGRIVQVGRPYFLWFKCQTSPGHLVVNFLSLRVRPAQVTCGLGETIKLYRIKCSIALNGRSNTTNGILNLGNLRTLV